ncbi:MAG: hypothetical protein JSV65_09615 [Armatimonadota bacterium]|nr:MAG: hypothetical protein JSV65_09615 [Armatimonadota bacterium]
MPNKIAEKLIRRLEELAEDPDPNPPKLKGARRKRKYEHDISMHARVRHDAAGQLLALLGPKAYLNESRILRALDKSTLDYQRSRQQVRTKGMMDRLQHVPEYIIDMPQLIRSEVRGIAKVLRDAEIRKVKVYGVGGSATPAGIAREIIENSGRLGYDFEVVRRDTPRFESVDDATLLIFASFSGNTEETLNCFERALKRKHPTDHMIAMSKGGKLKTMAADSKVPWIRIPARIRQPRESMVFQLTAILSVVSALKLPSGGSRAPFEVDDAMLDAAKRRLEGMRGELHWDVRFEANRAKQIAAKLVCGDVNAAKAGAYGAPWTRPCIPIVLSSASNQAVAYEFYTQLCEASKIVCHVATYPEALHNLVECMKFNLVSGAGVPWSLYFLESADDTPRVARRWRATLKEIFPDVAWCSFKAEGDTAFERALSGYYFNAWLRLYMAFLNGAEPLPVPTMDYMKDYMAGIPRKPRRPGSKPGRSGKRPSRPR